MDDVDSNPYKLNRRTAILLAVLTGFWSWLYTYGKDAWKFWVAWFLNTTPWLLYFIFFIVLRIGTISDDPLDNSGEGIAYVMIGASLILVGAVSIVWTVSWALVVLDALLKYPEKNPSKYTKNKRGLIILIILFGPFGWLYTYATDAKKFWMSFVSIVLGYLGVTFVVSGERTFFPISPLFSWEGMLFVFAALVFAWVAAVIHGIYRYRKWDTYQIIPDTSVP